MTRQELFELVWSEPVSRAAERFRVSGTWLRRVCLEEGVPIPPRGHWARVRAGQEVRRPRLPYPERADAVVQIRLGAQRPSPAPARPEPAALTARRAFEARPGNRITVRAGTPQHAWARELARDLRKGNALSQTGMREASTAADAVKVVVAETSIARAAALINALARALEKRGVELSPPNLTKWHHGARRHGLMIEGVPLTLRLSEKSTQVAKAKPEPPRNPWQSERRFDYRPTGQFTLRIRALEERYFPAERTLRDRPGAPLEERLNEVMVVITEAVCEVLQRRAERAEAERREAAARARRWELERERQAEAARRQALEEMAERWRRARLLRDFIAAVEAGGAVPGPPDAPQELAAWLQWARAHASELDPLLERTEP